MTKDFIKNTREGPKNLKMELAYDLEILPLGGYYSIPNNQILVHQKTIILAR